MDFINLPFLLLCFSTFLIVLLLFYIASKKPLNQLNKSFFYMLSCVFIICVGVLVQEYLHNIYHVDAMIFENFIYIGTCFLPVSVFFTALIFKNTRVKFEKKHLILFVVPIISLLVLWTNKFHHLFYVSYSPNITDTSFGPYFMIHSIYTYGLLFISIVMLIQTSFKTSGFFSMQSILLMFGTLIPIIINLLGTTKLVSMNVYLTPISFSVAMLLYAFAILKYNFLNISPIALQKIVNVMSDSYLVLDVNENIVDYNQTFVDTFNIKNATTVRNKKIFELLHSAKNIDNFKNAFYASLKDKKTSSIEFYDSYIDKYFNVEISPLYNKKIFIGVLILFKDITIHVNDMKKLKDNQDTLMESERLASLGQLIGGIAHNLKTPIMSIAGATEGIVDLIKEYDISIDDPEVNSQDHHDIANDMLGWTKKIKEYTEYMSDVITAVKGQAVAMSESDNITFDIEELVKRVNILMRHELKSAIVYLNVSLKVSEHTTLHGDINSLIQVINNMISNAIQAYNGKPEQSIDLSIDKDKKNNLVISIKDYGPGLPEKVKEKLFSEMITTKGKNGTGLGLYMSYSTIKAHFGGDITYQTEKGKGTTFNIILPL